MTTMDGGVVVRARARKTHAGRRGSVRTRGARRAAVHAGARVPSSRCERSAYCEARVGGWSKSGYGLVDARRRRSCGGGDAGGNMRVVVVNAASSSKPGPFASGSLPRKAGSVLLLLALARAGQYLPIAGLDKSALSAAPAAGSVLDSMQAALSGGGAARFGVLSLGIVPSINASIVMQLATVIFPGIKKMLREEGEAGRRQFLQYQRLVSLGFSVFLAFGSAAQFSKYVTGGTDLEWFVVTVVSLVTGAMVIMYISESIDEYKIGNGSSLLIFMNILSGLPASVSATVGSGTSSNVALVSAAVAVLLLTSGIVYVQEAERKLPLNYAQKYTATTLTMQRESYLPLKINSSGVMPIIMSSSFLTLPTVLAQATGAEWARSVALALSPNSSIYLPIEFALIVFFNGFYTKLQIDPKDLSENLQRSGASLVGVRPGTATMNKLEFTLNRLNVLGSVFLALLAIMPSAIEVTTGVQVFRGFTGTSLLILVGVATDTARKVKSELVMKKFEDVDSLYDNLKL